jgi:hypothetical protein
MKKVDTDKVERKREKQICTCVEREKKGDKYICRTLIQRKMELKREKQGKYMYKKIAKERNIIEKRRCGKKVQIKRERKRKCKHEIGRYRR